MPFQVTSTYLIYYTDKLNFFLFNLSLFLELCKDSDLPTDSCELTSSGTGTSGHYSAQALKGATTARGGKRSVSRTSNAELDLKRSKPSSSNETAAAADPQPISQKSTSSSPNTQQPTFFQAADESAEESSRLIGQLEHDEDLSYANLCFKRDLILCKIAGTEADNTLDSTSKLTIKCGYVQALKHCMEEVSKRDENRSGDEALA